MNFLPPRFVGSRDEKYMGLAFAYAGFSKDPNTQIGACITDSDGKPLGFGYNGPPNKIDDSKINWSRPDKYDYIIHAEQNAIDHSYGCLKGSVLYVTSFPCRKCMLNIVRSEIMEVVYYPFFSKDSGSMVNSIDEKSKEIAQLGGVRIREFKGSLKWLRNHLNNLNEIGVLY
jgi:dCMP deaminase